MKGHDIVAGHNYEDVVRDLKAVVDYDWDGFLQRRVAAVQETLPLDVVERLGYRLHYTDKAPTIPPLPPSWGPDPDVTAADSLGVTIVNNQITIVVPGLPADLSGMTPGMKVIGVNGKKLSANRLRDALAESLSRKNVEFLVEEGDEFRTFKIPYADGLRYLELVRIDNKPDLLGNILKPLSK